MACPWCSAEVPAGTVRCPSCKTSLEREVEKTNTSAVVSLVFGVVWLFGLGSVLALVFGALAKAQLAEAPEQGGGGLATAGIVLGLVGIVGGATLAAVVLLL